MKCAKKLTGVNNLTEADVGEFAALAAQKIFGGDVRDENISVFREKLISLNDVDLDVGGYARIRVVSQMRRSEGEESAKEIRIWFNVNPHHPKTQRTGRLAHEWAKTLNGIFKQKTRRDRPAWIKIHISERP